MMTDEPEVPPSRLPADVELQKRFEEFSAQAVHSIPELVALALVPVWVNQPENIPSGLVKLRESGPLYLHTLIRLLERLSIFGQEALSVATSQVQIYAAKSKELEQQIAERLEKLQQLETPPNDNDDK